MLYDNSNFWCEVKKLQAENQPDVELWTVFASRNKD